MRNLFIALSFILLLFSCKPEDENTCVGNYISRHAYVGAVDTNAQSIHYGDSVLFFLLNQQSMVYPDSCLSNNCSTTISIHNYTDDTITVKYTAEYFSATGIDNWSIVDSMTIPPSALKVEDEVVSYGCESISLGTLNVTPTSIIYQ